MFKKGDKVYPITKEPKILLSIKEKLGVKPYYVVTEGRDNDLPFVGYMTYFNTHDNKDIVGYKTERFALYKGNEITLPEELFSI
jgi:hypothetical protein